MNPLYLLSIFVLLVFNSIAQNVVEKVFNDTSLTTHQTFDMVIKADGSLVFCGGSTTNDSIPVHRANLLKLNADYSIAWFKSFERQDPYQYYNFNNIISVNDGGYLVTFNKGQFGSNVGIMKFDSLGNIQYERQLIDTIQQSPIELYNIIQITDSTFLLCMRTAIQNTVVLKIDLLGNILDNMFIQNATMIYSNTIVKLLDGNFLITMYEREGPNDLSSLLCFDQNLDPVWKKSYNEGPYWFNYYADYTMQLSDSSIWVLAQKNIGPSTAANEPVISKFTNQGDMIWSKKYSDTAHVNNWFCMAKELNGKIYTLMPFMYYSPTQVYILVFDTSGQLLSKQGYTYNISLHTQYFDIKNDSLLIPFHSYNAPADFGFIMLDTSLAHSCSSDIVTLSTDTINPLPYSFNSVLTNSVISSIDPQENYSIITNTLFEVPFCQPVNINQEYQTAINAYPNPANDYINLDISENSSKIEIHIFNAFGRKMLSESLSGIKYLTVDIHDYIPGVYFIRLSSESINKNVSFVKM